MEYDRLHPVEDDRGVWRFDPAEVECLVPSTKPTRPAVSDDLRQRQREGRIAARVFLLFARDASIGRIVVETKQPPERIRALYHQWVTGLDAGEWAVRE